MFGAPQKLHDDRYAVADEWITIIKRLWTEEGSFDFMGKHFSVPNAYSEPKQLRSHYPLIMSGGIRVFDNALQHRQAEQLALPIKQLPFEQELSNDKFIAISESLFLWSKKEYCQFFVRVYDDTGAQEKLVYKSRLRAVEARFYKWEVPAGRSRQN